MCAPWGTYKVTIITQDGTEAVIECDAILNATGRVPNVCNLGLEVVGVGYDNRSGVHIDDMFKTANDNIYSCGDCASPFKFTHAADWQV
jgi:pyruvate/2-oxoglutarate dehydrogenase complex dihydrolipoamide dehydrogenase (E3) component